MKGFFDDPTRGRYNTDTIVAAKNRRDERDYGPLHADGETWSALDDCNLLEWYLQGYPFRGSKTRALIPLLKRTERSIDTRIWKVCAHYNKGFKARMKAGPRTDRTGKPLSDQDLHVIKLATGETGRENGACLNDVTYLSLLLGRTPEDVVEKMQQILWPDSLHKGFTDVVEEIHRMPLPDLIVEVGKKLSDGKPGFKKKHHREESD